VSARADLDLNRQTDKPFPFRQTPSHRKGEHSSHFLQRGVQAVNPYKPNPSSQTPAVNESAGIMNVYSNAETITACVFPHIHTHRHTSHLKWVWVLRHSLAFKSLGL